MTRRGSPRLGAYAGFAALALVGGLVLGLPELVALAAPFALLLAVGLALARAPWVEVAAALDRERVLAGDEATLTLTVRAEASVERLEVLLALPEGLDAEANPRAVRLAAGEERELAFPLRCARWGGYAPGDVHLRARDRLAVFAFEERLDRRQALRVYPRPEQLLGEVRPVETQVYSGNQVARAKGEGIEFADIRPFVPGDRVRRVNWRASARRDELVVNELHPERNADVVLFLDTFTEVRSRERGTLDLAVAAAAALAAEYLERKDRVGIVGFGGVLNWLLPATGLVQRYRIADALLDTEVVLNYAWKDLDVIPRGTLPPQALVLALTPLLDDRSVRALLDLRARGFDLAVVELSPVPFAPRGSSDTDEVAYRLWLLGRDALRHGFQEAGVPVVEWRDGVPLAAALEEVKGFRRQARPARA